MVFLTSVCNASVTLRDRALDTIHEALTVAGGSCLTCTTLKRLVPIHLLSHTVYKYIMAGLVDPLAIMDEIP